MGTEIERKWTIDDLDIHLPKKCKKMEQYYLCINDKLEARIRRVYYKNGEEYDLIKANITIKSTGDIERVEINIEIDSKYYAEMNEMRIGDVIAKRRYEIMDGINKIEIDVYDEQLRGLVVAEVEFESIENAIQYQPPPWFGKEITNDDGYKNKMLAVRGIPN